MTHGSGDSIKLNPEEVHSGASSIGEFGESMAAHQSTTSSSTSRLKSGVSSDRSGMGKVLIEGTQKIEEVATKASSQMSRLGAAMKQRLDKGMDAHVANEEQQVRTFGNIHPEEKTPTPHSETHDPTSADTSGTPRPSRPPTPHASDSPAGGNSTSSTLPPENYKAAADQPPTIHPNGIVSTPVSSFHGFHGQAGDYQHYKGNLDGVKRPTGDKGQGNGEPDWQGWYLAEDKHHAAGYAVDDNAPMTGGGIMHYNFPEGTTVHDIPTSMYTDVDKLKQHFGIDNDTPLVDGVGKQNGVLRLPIDDEASDHEVIVPWNLAPKGTATHVGMWNVKNNEYSDGLPPKNHPWSTTWSL
ncbi:MAG TPA: hypothetical protein VJ914_14675 [Pseudonocardiaceae bacterium]|nr:hypothetical protein [Pseudonocardiaceae bacterium]